MSTPHSAHRPPAPPPIAFGNVYPKGDIMAVVHDRATAQWLVSALQASGFPETDMDILEPAFVLEAAETLARQRGWLARLGSVLGDEGYFADQFLELVRQGHAIVLIHAPDEETLQRARPVLARHHVLKARHYGDLTVTDV
jgi:hypothetical protein